MAKETVMVRVLVETKKKLEEVAASDRRSLVDTLDILLLDAIAQRKVK
jgi:hypothetical protein